MSPVRATASVVIACGIAILGSVLAVLACLIKFVDTLMLRATPEGQPLAALLLPAGVPERCSGERKGDNRCT